MINLYFDPKTKIHYYNSFNTHCNACDNIISDIIIIRAFWHKLGSGMDYLCMACKDTANKSATVTEEIKAIVTEDIPSKAMPRIFSKPSLNAVRDLMNVDVAGMSLDYEHVTDKTVYSGRVEDKVKEYVIEDASEDIELKLEHKPMNDNELDNFFSSVKSAVPMIEETTKKVLE